MPAPPASRSSRSQKTTGLRYWMEQVLVECDHVSADFSHDSVHDLRVALRRCRSLVDGLIALDPDPEWRAMKKAGKRLFQRLGDLRDIHVMQEWVEKLEKLNVQRTPSSTVAQSPQNSLTESEEERKSPAQSLFQILKFRETEHQREAQSALDEFDRKQWRRWSRVLPARAARIRAGSPLFKHLALERWTEARTLHARALRNRSQTAFHALRIGIKRFRYIVENFLPIQHQSWRNDLKEMQDLLGEVHDLDVLWSTAISCEVLTDQNWRRLWREIIQAERSRRIEAYRACMVGENSFWQTWRAALPQGKQVQDLATRRLKFWAAHLDPDFSHSERVARLAIALYDELLRIAWQPAIPHSARATLFAAALLHDVGRSRGEKNHHKKSFKLIRSYGNPLGWNASEFHRAAIVARFHRGSLPTKHHSLLRDLLPEEQKSAIHLAAILRLANAMDVTHDRAIRRLHIQNVPVNIENRKTRLAGFLRKATLDHDKPLIILAEGYVPFGVVAQAIAAERHLLETILRRPVMVRAFAHAGPVSGVRRQ